MPRSTESLDFPAPVAPKMTTSLSLRFLGRDCSMRTETGWFRCLLLRRLVIERREECDEKDGDVIAVVVRRSEIIGRKLSSVIARKETKQKKKQKQKKQQICVFRTDFCYVFCNDAHTLYNLSFSLSFSISDF